MGKNIFDIFNRLHFASTAKLALPTLISIPITLASVPLCLGAIGTDAYGFLLLVLLIINQSHILMFGLEKNLIRGSINRTLDICDLQVAKVFAVVKGAFISMLLLFVLNLSGSKDQFPIDEFALYALLIGVPLHFLWTTQRAVLQASDHFKLLGLATFAYMSAGHYVPLVLILLSPSLISLTYFILGIMAARLAVIVILLFHSFKLPKKSITTSIGNLWNLIGYGKWMGLNQTIQIMFEGADRYLLGLLVSPAAVAVYGVPLQFVQKLSSFPVALAQIVFNKSVKASKSRASSYVSDLLTLVPFLAAIFFSLYEVFFEVWLGQNFLPIFMPLAVILFIGINFTALNFVFSSIIEASGNARQIALFDLVALLPFLLILVWLIGAYGVLGAATAMAGKEFIFFLSRLFIFRANVTLVVKSVTVTSILCFSGYIALSFNLSVMSLAALNILICGFWALGILAMRSSNLLYWRQH